MGFTPLHQKLDGMARKGELTVEAIGAAEGDIIQGKIW
jgi:hypothetical protein